MFTLVSDVHCLGSEGTGDLESTSLTISELDSDSTQNAGQFYIQDSLYLRKTSWWLCTRDFQAFLYFSNFKESLFVLLELDDLRSCSFFDLTRLRVS